MKPLTAQICLNSGREEDHDDGGPHGAKASGKTETAKRLAGSVVLLDIDAAEPVESGWLVTWPAPGAAVVMTDGESPLLRLPLEHDGPVIHARKWWNWFMANPLGYLPEGRSVETIHIGLPARQYLAFGPDWIRGWMFSFFLAFLVSSVAFKFQLKID